MGTRIRSTCVLLAWACGLGTAVAATCQDPGKLTRLENVGQILDDTDVEPNFGNSADTIWLAQIACGCTDADGGGFTRCAGIATTWIPGGVEGELGTDGSRALRPNAHPCP